MKKYYRAVQQDIDEVGLDVVIGDAVLALVESGIDEDAHFWDSAWRDIDDDDLEFALNSSQVMSQVIEYIRLPMIEKLREVLASRRAETQREKERT